MRLVELDEGSGCIPYVDLGLVDNLIDINLLLWPSTHLAPLFIRLMRAPVAAWCAARPASIQKLDVTGCTIGADMGAALLSAGNKPEHVRGVAGAPGGSHRTG
jgi:hypothetical protein